MIKPVQIIAAIDIGSNSVHMLLAYLNGQGKLVTIKSYKKILSLGSSLTKTNELPQSALDNTCLAIDKMKERALHYKPLFMIVGTHAVRAATNKQKLVDSIYRTSKLHIRVLPGEEEARLMGLSISHSFFTKNKEILCLDIGGGSTEFAIYKNHKPLYLKSLKLGSVVLTSKFLKNKGKSLNNNHIATLKKEVRQILKPVIHELKPFRFKKSVICSGLGKTLAFMDHMERNGRSLKNPDRYILSRKCLNHFHRRVCLIKQAQKIKQEWKISLNRSEILLAGLLVLQILTEELRIPFWMVSNHGIREGIILDTAKENNNK